MSSTIKPCSWEVLWMLVSCSYVSGTFSQRVQYSYSTLLPNNPSAFHWRLLISPQGRKLIHLFVVCVVPLNICMLWALLFSILRSKSEWQTVFSPSSLSFCCHLPLACCLVNLCQAHCNNSINPLSSYREEAWNQEELGLAPLPSYCGKD